MSIHRDVTGKHKQALAYVGRFELSVVGYPDVYEAGLFRLTAVLLDSAACVRVCSIYVMKA